MKTVEEMKKKLEELSDELEKLYQEAPVEYSDMDEWTDIDFAIAQILKGPKNWNGSSSCEWESSGC